MYYTTEDDGLYYILFPLDYQLGLQPLGIDNWGERKIYIYYECNRYKWKTTNNMFISIKKIIYVALNICMSWTQKKYMHVFLPCSEY